jgi:hypothetical protein
MIVYFAGVIARPIVTTGVIAVLSRHLIVIECNDNPIDETFMTFTAIQIRGDVRRTFTGG